jgi:hypothetical protein
MFIYWIAAACLALILAYSCLGTLTGSLPTEDPRSRPTHVYVR